MATNDVDEDYISCHVCLFRYDEAQRKPKFLDCHHSFCRSCIKDLISQQSLTLRNVENAGVHCPTCRHPTHLTGRNIDDLATNNLALRLLAIETKKAEEAVVHRQTVANLKKVKMWCVECESLASERCRKKTHIMYEYQQVYSEQLILLEGQANLCRPDLEKAVEDWQTTQTVYLQVQESLRTLLADVNAKIEANDGRIALFRSTIQEITDLPIIPSNDESTEEEYLNTIEQMKGVATRFVSLNNEASAEKMSAMRQLNLVKEIEESYVELKWKKARRPNNLFKQLQLAFSGGNDTDPNMKSCISVLSYLILLLNERGAGKVNEDLGNGDDGWNSVPSPDAVGSREQPMHKQSGSSENPKNTGARPKFPKKGANPDAQLPSASHRPKDSLPLTKATPLPGKLANSKFYFRFAINGEITKLVIIQLESELAPVMCSKFAILCTGKEGPTYRGSVIFKVNKNQSITGGFVENEADKEWRKKFFYIADRCTLPEKRGSIRMHINRIVDWKAEISTEFLIILADRPEKRKFSTVFGRVIEGLTICDKISQLNMDKFKVVIAECGPY